jgi:hypothetical protein
MEHDALAKSHAALALEYADLAVAYGDLLDDIVKRGKPAKAQAAAPRNAAPADMTSTPLPKGAPAAAGKPALAGTPGIAGHPKPVTAKTLAAKAAAGAAAPATPPPTSATGPFKPGAPPAGPGDEPPPERRAPPQPAPSVDEQHALHSISSADGPGSPGGLALPGRAQAAP